MLSYGDVGFGDVGFGDLGVEIWEVCRFGCVLGGEGQGYSSRPSFPIT